MYENHIADISLAPEGEKKIRWAAGHMPVLAAIAEDFRETKPLTGLRVALSVHLEAKTAWLCRVMEMGGAEMHVTGSNPLSTQDDVADAAKYITKYMEKSGERLVYGGKLPTYFLSDVLDEDVACPYGVDDRKVLLFDNFTCINEGEILGKVSKEVIDLLPKSN